LETFDVKAGGVEADVEAGVEVSDWVGGVFDDGVEEGPGEV
jgi:hypothetical protein